MYAPDYVKQNDPNHQANYRPVAGSGTTAWVAAIVIVVLLAGLLALGMRNAGDGVTPMPADTSAPAATQMSPADTSITPAPADNGATLAPTAPAQ